MKSKVLHFSSAALVAAVGIFGSVPSAKAATQTWNTGSGTWDLTQAVWTPGPLWTNGNDAAINRSDVPFITIGSNAITAGTITITNTGTPVFQGNLNNLSFTSLNINTTGAGKLAVWGNTAGASTSNILSGGTINIASGATLYLQNNGSATNTTVASNITVTGTGNSEARGAIRLATGTKISGNVTLIGNSNLGVDAGTAEISGNVTGAFGITKVQTGTLTLSGINDYTGATTVSAGTLSVTGSAMVASGTSGVSIASGATLAVTGTLKLVSNTSKIANSGTFNLSAGTDVLDLNGQITGLTDGSTYNLFSTVGTITGNFNTITGYDTTNFLAALNTSNGVITFTAVPEPSTYGLIGAGALAAVAFVRRRRKHAGKVSA